LASQQVNKHIQAARGLLDVLALLYFAAVQPALTLGFSRCLMQQQDYSGAHLRPLPRPRDQPVQAAEEQLSNDRRQSPQR
jgi:hypothetical protein